MRPRPCLPTDYSPMHDDILDSNQAQTAQETSLEGAPGHRHHKRQCKTRNPRDLTRGPPFEERTSTSKAITIANQVLTNTNHHAHLQPIAFGPQRGRHSYCWRSGTRFSRCDGADSLQVAPPVALSPHVSQQQTRNCPFWLLKLAKTMTLTHSSTQASSTRASRTGLAALSKPTLPKILPFLVNTNLFSWQEMFWAAAHPST